MTYLESAEDMIITKARMIQELEDHGCKDQLEEALIDLGDLEYYDATSVLHWLGH